MYKLGLAPPYTWNVFVHLWVRGGGGGGGGDGSGGGPQESLKMMTSPTHGLSRVDSYLFSKTINITFFITRCPCQRRKLYYGRRKLHEHLSHLSAIEEICTF